MSRPTLAIETILVPLDLTRQAEEIVDWAAELAQMTGARLALLHVLPPVYSYAVPLFPDPTIHGENYARARNAARDRLWPLAYNAQAKGVEVSVSVRVGFAAEEILTVAHELDAGIIIVGSHGRTGVARLFLGSTAEKVVRLADCPVFVVKTRPAAAREEKTKAALATMLDG